MTEGPLPDRDLAPSTPGEAGGLSGLDYNHQTSTKKDALTSEDAEVDLQPSGTGCPHRRGLVYLNLLTGETAPVRCGRLSCDYCATRNAWRRSLAIAYAKPQRAITLTLVADEADPDPWPTARRRYTRTREWVRRLGHDPGEWVVHVEPNPRETGFHAHIWQHSEKPVPKAVLQEAAHHAGAGWSRIEAIRSSVGASTYGLKGMGYGLKGVTGSGDAESSPAEYLRVNGRRLTHQSPGFFRSPEGATLGVREAEKRALHDLLGERLGTWTLATESGARAFISLPRGNAPLTPTPSQQMKAHLSAGNV